MNDLRLSVGWTATGNVDRPDTGSCGRSAGGGAGRRPGGPGPAVLALIALGVLATGTASAHGGTAGSGVPTLGVVVGSALVGTVSGLGAVVVETRRVMAVVSNRRFTAALGIGLTVLGLSFVAPLAGDAPAAALAGVGGGVAVASWVPHRHVRSVTVGHDGFVLGVVGAIGLHRLFEGVVLAAGFLAGSTVGLVTAVVVTLHAAGETVAVATVLTLDGRPRLAVLAVLAVQTGFVLAAAGATLTAVSVPLLLRSLVVTVAAGVLIYFGVHECRQCFLDWRRAT